MTDGNDWADVPEGVQYTPEQAARRFLSLTWEEQVERMQRFLQDSEAAHRCAVMSHAGAVEYAQKHRCPDNQYQEGWEHGWKDAFAELDRRIEALGK